MKQKSMVVAIVALVTFVIGFASPALANEISPNPVITKITAEQKGHEIWLTVFHKVPSLGMGTLTLTQPQIAGSTFKRTESANIAHLEGWWKFKFYTYSPGQEATYQFTAQMSIGSVVSAPFNFSFTYSKPNWQQAGCDDLWGLNQEALEWDSYAARQANFEVQLQRDYPTVSKYGCPNQLAWKWKTVKVKEFVWQYTLCNDGWRSSSVGRGTCSWHGGIHSYRGYYKTVNAKRPQFYWVY